MGRVKNETLDGWHAWRLSEVMGIGRCTREDGYTGGEINGACVWADYRQQTWSHTRAQNASVLLSDKEQNNKKGFCGLTNKSGISVVTT